MSVMRCEKWLPVVGHKGYEVSDRGGVRSIPRTVTERTTGRVRNFSGHLLRPKLTRGYHQVVLSVSGVRNLRYVHQLVCEAFNGQRTARDTRHLDGNPLNNTPQNLKWGTPQENANDRVLHGRTDRPRGPRNWDQLYAEIMRYGEPLHHSDDYYR